MAGMNRLFSYLSMMTGSDGVSFRFPQLFLSQQRLLTKSIIDNLRLQVSYRLVNARSGWVGSGRVTLVTQS